MAKRDPHALLAPTPRLTNQLREDVMWCALHLQNLPEKFTEALRDPETRREMRQLVGDLFSLVEIIADDAQPQT